MSLLGATILTGIATAVLAVGALVTAWYARRAFRAQSSQLEDQRKELQEVAADRQRDAAERHRAQALQVYLQVLGVRPTYDLDPYAVAARVRNTSQQPVYDLRYKWYVDDRPDDDEVWHGSLMPGAQAETAFECSPNVAPGQVSAMVVFRDRAGAWWSTRADGQLEEVPAPPPPSWATRPAASAATTAPDAGEPSR